MKKIMQLFIIIFLFSAISCVEYSFAYQENPTPPTILDLTHSTPVPNYSMCIFAFDACASSFSTSYTNPIYLADNCGDPNYYEIFSNSPSDPMGCADSELHPIECKTCDNCPSGQYRMEGMCVPEAALSCVHGVANYLTGECYPASCPNGDGTPEDCKQIPSCVESELTTLVTSGSENSCQCMNGLQWNAENHKCEPPACDGENGSPIDSIFDSNSGSCACPSTHTLLTNTNTCVRFECENSNEIFVSSRAQCEVATDCPFNETLITATNTCRKYIPFEGTCDQVFSEHLPESEASFIAACQACVSSGGSPVLHPISYFVDENGAPRYYRYMNYCVTTANHVCGTFGGEYDFELDECLNADEYSSSSSSSFSQSSQSSQSVSSSSNFSSASFASSINSGGGSGSSSGSNTSSGSGNGNGNGSGDGSGGNGSGSASSAASAGNNSSQGAGQCDPESKDYMSCIAPDVKDLPPHNGTASGATSIDQVNANFNNRLRNSPIVGSFDKFKNIISVQNSECPEFSIDLSDTPLGTIISTDIHCQLMENIRPILSVVMFAVFTFLAFRIFASA